MDTHSNRCLVKHRRDGRYEQVRATTGHSHSRDRTADLVHDQRTADAARSPSRRRYTVGFLERILARVPITALLQGGYTVRDNVRECADEA